MIDSINSWTQAIIIVAIVTGIIEMILPEGNNKKYIKTVIGIYIVFVILNPIIAKVSNKNININSILETEMNKIDKYKIDNISIETASYIEETYSKKIEEEIRKSAREKNYLISNLEIDIEKENEGKYGEINGISMKIAKLDEKEEANNNKLQNNIDSIKQVEINISNTANIESNNEKNNINISENEIYSFKEYISTTYGTEKDRIFINE